MRKYLLVLLFLVPFSLSGQIQVAKLQTRTQADTIVLDDILIVRRDSVGSPDTVFVHRNLQSYLIDTLGIGLPVGTDSGALLAWDGSNWIDTSYYTVADNGLVSQSAQNAWTGVYYHGGDGINTELTGLFGSGNTREILFSVDTAEIVSIVSDSIIGGIWSQNGSDAYYNTGNVGIGTDSPFGTMHLKANNPSLYLQDDNSASNIDAQVYFLNSSLSSKGGFGFNNSKDFNFQNLETSGDFDFDNGANDLLTIKNGGQIQFDQYDGTTYTGTRTGLLGVESDGDVISVSESSLSITESQISDLNHTTDTRFGLDNVAFTDNRYDTLNTYDYNLIYGMGSYRLRNNGIFQNKYTGGATLNFESTATDGIIGTSNDFPLSIISNDIERINVATNGTTDVTGKLKTDSLVVDMLTEDNALTDFLVEGVGGQVYTRALSSITHDAVTLSGTPDYITLSGQDIIRGQIDLTTDVTGVLPQSNFDVTGDWTGTLDGQEGAYYLDSKWTRDSGNGEIYPTTLTDQVGIGTADPDFHFHIFDSGNVTSLIESSGGRANAFIESGSGTDFSRFIFKQGAATHRWEAGMSEDNDDQFYIAHGSNMADKYFAFTNTGRLGIDQTSPTHKLHVNGGIRIGNTTTANTGAIRWNGTNFQGYNGAWVNLDDSGSDTNLGTDNLTADADRTYTLDGNRLDIIGSGLTTTFASNGNVGIGTTSANTDLEILSSVPSIQLSDSDDANNLGVRLYSNDVGVDEFRIQQYSDLGAGNYMARFQSGITSPGYYFGASGFGVFDDTPQQALDVNGAIKIGTTASDIEGTIRYVSGTGDFEGYDGVSWEVLNAAGGSSIYSGSGSTQIGSVTEVTLQNELKFINDEGYWQLRDDANVMEWSNTSDGLTGFIDAGQGNFRIGTSSSDAFAIYTDNTKRYDVSSSGNHRFYGTDGDVAIGSSGWILGVDRDSGSQFDILSTIGATQLQTTSSTDLVLQTEDITAITIDGTTQDVTIEEELNVETWGRALMYELSGQECTTSGCVFDIAYDEKEELGNGVTADLTTELITIGTGYGGYYRITLEGDYDNSAGESLLSHIEIDGTAQDDKFLRPIKHRGTDESTHTMTGVKFLADGTTIGARITNNTDNGGSISAKVLRATLIVERVIGIN